MLFIYRCLTLIIFPLFILIIFLRSFFEKEDKKRFKEKIFSKHFNVEKNKDKKLIWFHAASIGEVLSILPLIEKINSSYKDVDFLITTVTLTSKKLLEKKLHNYTNVTHRFFPLDTKKLSKDFLDLWKPDLVCFVDSEIWPNFLFRIKKKSIPLILINGRITNKTFNKWKIIINFARKVFSNFDLCLASSEDSRNNLLKLEVKNLKYIGNLKYSTKNNLEEIKDFNKIILDKFKTWCAVSTHDGEELVILKAHKEIKKKYNNILTIIIPRHIDRSFNIKNISKKLNLNPQILNEDELIKPETEILIINSVGILSSYFNYCKNIFIGKSFIKKKKNVGGQNPIEAAKLGCKIFHGPYVYNFQEIYEHLKSYGATEMVNNEFDLAEKIVKNLDNPTKMNQQQISLLNIYGEKILNETSKEIEAYLR
jgi:3-deoxy-D-manno-octulosonic-acid transferase